MTQRLVASRSDGCGDTCAQTTTTTSHERAYALATCCCERDLQHAQLPRHRRDRPAARSAPGHGEPDRDRRRLPRLRRVSQRVNAWCQQQVKHVPRGTRVEVVVSRRSLVCAQESCLPARSHRRVRSCLCVPGSPAGSVWRCWRLRSTAAARCLSLPGSAGVVVDSAAHDRRGRGGPARHRRTARNQARGPQEAPQRYQPRKPRLRLRSQFVALTPPHTMCIRENERTARPPEILATIPAEVTT